MSANSAPDLSRYYTAKQVLKLTRTKATLSRCIKSGWISQEPAGKKDLRIKKYRLLVYPLPIRSKNKKKK